MRRIPGPGRGLLHREPMARSGGEPVHGGPGWQRPNRPCGDWKRMFACWPRRSTRPAVRWSGTSRRRSATSGWSTPRGHHSSPAA